MAAPAWLAATAQRQSLPGQINQFLASHESAWVYAGNAVQASATIGTAVYASTAGQYLAQPFVTGSTQTTIGQLLLQVSTVGGSPITATISPLAVSLYASSAGLPTGSALTTTYLAEQVVYAGPFWLSVPLSATVTAATQYQIVVAPAGGGSAYYAWQQASTGVAAVSTDGITWTAQAFGLMYQVLDNTGTIGAPQQLVDDNGARVTNFTYTSSGQLTGIAESVVTQTGATFYSTRTIAYSGQYPTGVS